VVADQCLVAGSVATIAMLKGAQAREWLEGAGLPWLIVSAEGRIAGTVATRVK
jgi:FAD:protein FMN transferase